MEEDQDVVKHTCKLCNKGFPCGRSLGGHMRSHVIFPFNHQYQQKLSNNNNNNQKLSLVNNGGNNINYGLREYPKKTCKFQDSSDNSVVHDKLCIKCGKTFESCKALFGHMKCHSNKISKTCRVDEHQDSLTAADYSENETAAPSKKKKRSSRKVKRYSTITTAAATITTTTTTSSSSLSFNANASLSVSEHIEQEQEEVAMCLIMLSKDVTNWGRLHSMGDSSDNIISSKFLKAKTLVTNSSELDTFKKLSNGGELDKFNNLRNGCELDKFKNLRNGGELDKFKNIRNGGEVDKFKNIRNGGELCASGIRADGTKLEKSGSQFVGSSVDENLKKYRVQDKMVVVKETEFDQEVELGTKKHPSSKRKVVDLFSSKLEVSYSDFTKSSKFECGSCNKAFGSFQALGGHRASHKKLKGCCSLKADGCENSSIGIDDSLSTTPNTAAANNRNIPSTIDHQVVAKRSHECPICYRVFSSGQALGGHKRSHLIAEAKNNQTNTSIVAQKPVPEIQNFLDLNLPAPIEEEEEDSSTISGLGFSTWWLGSSHTHESLLRLLSSS